MAKKCRKLVFSTESKAWDIAAHVLGSGRAKSQRVYFCPRCKGYHTTSMTLRTFKETRNGDR